MSRRRSALRGSSESESYAGRGGDLRWGGGREKTCYLFHGFKMQGYKVNVKKIQWFPLCILSYKKT